MSPYRLRAYIQMLSVVLIWGVAAVVIKATLNQIEPVLFLSYRFFISSIVALFSIHAIWHTFKKSSKTSLLILAYTFLSVPVALGFLFWGLSLTTVVNLSILTAVSPILLTVAGVHFFHDHITKRAKVGALLALSGAILTTVEPIIENYNNLGSMLGSLLLIIYLVSDIAGILLLKKLVKQGVSPSVLTNVAFLTGFLVFTPILLIQTPLFEILNKVYSLPLSGHLGVIYMALISGTIAYNLRAKSQKFLTISEASLFGYLTPIISTILALLFLQEQVTPTYIAGATIIAIGVFLVEYKKSRLKARALP